MRIESLEEMRLQSPQRPPELIGHGVLLEQSKGVLFGAPKIFKSLMAQQMAFTIASGIDWLGFPVKQGKVLYLQSEISRWPFRNRILKMATGHQIPSQTLYFCTEFGLQLDVGLSSKELETHVGRIKPQLLVLDPLYQLISFSSEEAIHRLLKLCDRLIDNYHLSVLLVHHSRKPRLATSGTSVDMGGTELRGPLIEQWADSIIRLRGDISNNLRTLDFELRHGENIVPSTEVFLDRQKLWFYRL